MTNKEAIKILVGNRNFYERIVRPYDREMVEALNMAIKALEEVEGLPENLHREREQAYMNGYDDGYAYGGRE